MRSLVTMWLLSLVAAVGTGWLAFAQRPAPPVLHALFLLSVAGFVACSIWTLARGLSPLREQTRNQDAPQVRSDDDEPPP